MKRIALWLTAVILPLGLSATDKIRKPDPVVTAQKVVASVRADEPVQIDGILNEKVWQRDGSSDFIQSDPVDGGQPTEKTKVWVAYDDANLYVAAYCYDSDPSAIKKRLGRRDDMVDSDWFMFSVDPYYDRRTGYLFAVNPAGSIMDSVLVNDVGEDGSWDGVWEGKTHINGDGWTVEMRIPLNQIRFPKKDEYVWGVNFRRIIQRKHEVLSYVWIPKDQNANVSRFARLEGIRNINPGSHLEIFPYTVGSAQFKPAETGNPFQTGKKFLGNAGFDLKLGLKSNLTLDATINPDFGQVEVDPAVINLSAYETYYQEKRPFFIEGANIFDGFGRGGVYLNANINWPSPTFFYSRRIGRSPQGFVTSDGYADVPDRSTILGALKLTGKLGGGWNVGAIGALTSREFADIDNLGSRFQEEVEPLSWYGVIRAQKDINDGQRGFGIMATGVTRDLRNDTLSGIINKNAFSFAGDGWAFLDKKRSWVVGGWLGGTRIEGSREDIFRLQTSSMHYFQRPDASHLELDPNATSLSGWAGRFSLAKQQGKFLFLATLGALSPGFDPNDMGFQFSSSDLINITVLPAVQWTKPGKVFRNALLFAGLFRNYDFQGNRIWDGVLMSFQGQLLNYWNFNTMFAYNPQTISNRLTRGGPLALVPWGYEIDLNLSSDNRKAVVASANSNYYRRPDESVSWDGSVYLTWKPKTNVSLSVGPGYSIYKSETQWVSRVMDPLMTETFGSRYIFGRIDQQTIYSEIRLNWIFTPRLSLQLYLQPFISAGRYDRFKELAKPKTRQYNVYGEGNSSIATSDGNYVVTAGDGGSGNNFSFGNPDFNYKSLRGTIVLRWEYLPGSLLYFVWTQNRTDYAHPGDFEFRRDLSSLLTAPGDNIFMLKFSYRWSL